MADKPNGENNGRVKRPLWAFYLVALVVIGFIALASMIVVTSTVWSECTINLPDKSGSVVFMARLNKILCAEWDRKVRIQLKRCENREHWVPEDMGGAWPINVYWYPRTHGNGPYLRFHDPMWEYLVDLKSCISLYIVRGADGNAYVGNEITTGRPKGAIGASSLSATINGRSRKLDDFVGSSRGIYIGRIEYPFDRFVPISEAHEEALPEH